MNAFDTRKAAANRRLAATLASAQLGHRDFYELQHRIRISPGQAVELEQMALIALEKHHDPERSAAFGRSMQRARAET